MNDEPTLITRLEAQIAELHHDWKIAQAISKNTNPTALGEYIALREDVRIVLGIRYVSLASIAEEYQLYQDNREISQLKDLIGREIDLPSQVDTLYSIHTVRTKYSKVYELDYRTFDRYERLVKEMTRDLNEWGTKISVTPNEDRHEDRTSRHDVLDMKPAFQENIQPVAKTQDSNIFTEEQVKTLLRSEQTRNIKSFIVLTTIAIISGIISIPVTNQQSQISREEAELIVQRWLIAKKKLFGSPFDWRTAGELTTGKAYAEKVKGPNSNGNMSESEWLKNNGYSYNYGSQKIDSIDNFKAIGNTALIDIKVTEQKDLYNSKGELQIEKSGTEQTNVRYSLIKENGVVKIVDYNTVDNNQ
jgi:ARC6-like, IMS domain